MVFGKYKRSVQEWEQVTALDVVLIRHITLAKDVFFSLNADFIKIISNKRLQPLKENYNSLTKKYFKILKPLAWV